MLCHVLLRIQYTNIKFCLEGCNSVKQFYFKMIYRIIASKENNYATLSCGKVDSTFYLLLYCKDVIMFWKMICNLIFHLFQVELQINQKILVVGKDKRNKKYNLLNIIFNYGKYAIYKCYIKKIVNYSVIHPHALFLIQVVAKIVFKG